MPTTPRGIWTPDLPNNYNLITDWATNATSIDTAIGNVATRIAAERGTAAQRVAMTATTTNGYLWQDTDTLKMLWRRDTTVSGGWAPAVWRWGGTTAQMNSFTQAPNGFEWFNTTDNSDYVRLGGVWKPYINWKQSVAGADSSNFAPPADGTPPIIKTGYLKTTRSSTGGFTITFGTPFPNRCLHLSATPIEGTGIAPVVNGRIMSAASVDMVALGSGVGTIALTWMALGY